MNLMPTRHYSATRAIWSSGLAIAVLRVSLVMATDVLGGKTSFKLLASLGLHPS